LYGYVLGDPVGFIDPEGKFYQYFVAVIVIIGGYAIETWIKKWIKSKTSKIIYKKGFCNTYIKSNNCDASLLYMNGFCGSNVDCKDYSDELYKKCRNKTLICGDKICNQ